MMSFSRQAIAIAENFARNYSEVQILHARGIMEKGEIKPHDGYTSATELYTGDADKVTLLVEQEIFDHFSKSKGLKDKLKNTYQPWLATLEAEPLTIYIIGK